MADTLEIRLGGQVAGRPLTAGDIDYSELHPLIDHIETAVEIEADLDTLTKFGVPKNRIRHLRPVRLALSAAYTPKRDTAGPVGAVYVFTVGPEMAEAVAKITAGLAGVAGNQLVPEAAEQVLRGLRRAIGRGLSIQLVNGVTTPTFSDAHPPPELAVYPTRRFESEIAAHILNVGGKKPTARVKLLGSGQVVTVDLSGKTVAQELGKHLYRDAILQGKGTWVIDPARFYAPTRLLQLKVVTYRLLRDVSMETVIDEMTTATDGALDHVDPTNPDDTGDVPGATGDLSRQ